jgi:hypothetical protein
VQVAQRQKPSKVCSMMLFLIKESATRPEHNKCKVFADSFRCCLLICLEGLLCSKTPVIEKCSLFGGWEIEIV